MGSHAGRFGGPVIGAVAASLLAAQPAHADRSLLWNVVTFKCLRHLTKSEAPIPCDSVDVADGWDHGVAYLKDSEGVVRMLAIPTHRVSGIDDASLLTAEEPNYFASAWAGRALVEHRLGRDLPREDFAVTVDSARTSGQDQLFLRIDCVDRDIAASLASYSARLETRWRVMTTDINGRPYWARKLDSTDLSDVSPFRLLADGIDGARGEMGLWSLAAVGADFDGRPGFILLAERAEPGAEAHPPGLQDPSCAIARSRP
jgi:CDP-diacylglycerol pyrophosphatase